MTKYSGYTENNLYFSYSQYFFWTTYDHYLFSIIKLVLSHTLYKFIIWARWAEIQSCLESKLKLVLTLYIYIYIYIFKKIILYLVLKSYWPLIFWYFQIDPLVLVRWARRKKKNLNQIVHKFFGEIYSKMNC